MRISDWSSDVCSSDLAPLAVRTGLSGGFSKERISAAQRPSRVHEALSEACNTWHQARLPSTSAGTSAPKALNIAATRAVLRGALFVPPRQPHKIGRAHV